MRKFLALAIAALMVLLSVASAFAEGGETGDFIVLSGSPEDGAEAGTAGGNGSGRPVAMTDAGAVRGEPLVDSAGIREDDREVIYITDWYPYVAVAYMDIDYRCGCENTGTGFMVERNKLFTAAHCIVCTTHNQWADHIDFYFGFTTLNDYAYKYSGRWYATVGNTFPNGYTTDGDWAVVKFYENVGDTTGWFGFRYDMPDSEITSKELHLLGYRFGTLRLSSGSASRGYGDLLNYQIDMEPGNSGGPVFYLDGETPYAVAINIAENEEKQTNYGYRITKEVYGYFMDLDNH